MGRFAAILLLCVPVVGCKREAVAPLPVAVQVATLAREPITSETRFSATIREQQRIELSFKVPGTVEELLQVAGPDGKPRDVHEGDVVTSDPRRPLAKLDDSDYRRRVAACRDRLAQAKAKQRAVTAAVVAVRANFERIKSLRERNSVAQQTYDDMLAKRDAAEAERDAAEREVSAASVGLQQAVDDLEHCSLRLPIPEAVISHKFIETGERVAAGRPVFEVMDLSRLRAAFGVPDTQVDQFHIGQRLTVMADAFRGEQFTGQVTKIQPAADPRTRSFEVEVTIDHPKALKPGMIVTIVVGRREEVVLIPMTAVQRGKTTDDFTVFQVVERDGREVVERRRVALDGIYDNRVRLIEGPPSQVRQGDRIVVVGAFRVADGEPVRIIDAPETAER